MAVVSLDGVVLAYEEAGTGKPLLLVHGHPFDRTMWQPQLEAFADAGYRVIVPDLRGFGQSAAAPEAVAWEAYAEDLAALLGHLDVRQAVVAGLSMGGQIVLELYRRHPELVEALVICDSFAQLDAPGKREWRYATADRLEREGMAEYADEVLTSMVAPYNVAARPEVADHVLRMMRGAPPAGAAAALRSRAERPDYVPLLGGIRVPVLVVVGRDDAFTPVADAEFMAERIPGARLAVVEGAGHLPNLERPDEFNGLLRGFLDAVAEQVPPGS